MEQSGRCGRPVVASVSAVPRTVAHVGYDVSSGCNHFADCVVVRVADEQIAGRIERQTNRAIERCHGRCAAVTRVIRDSGAGVRDNLASGLDHLANHVVAGIGNE